MKETLERLRRLARSGLARARAVLAQARPLLLAALETIRETAAAGVRRTRAVTLRTWRAMSAHTRAGWISFRDSWTKKDWFAGMEPLPPGLASNLAAIAIVTGLVLTSLLYADYYERQAMEARMIASGEHPSQQPPPGAGPEAEPVPEQVTPEASPAPSAAALPQTGETFIERFDRSDITDRWNISHGWSNGSWMLNDWRRSEVEVKPGLLTLHLRRGPEEAGNELSSGEIQSHQRHRYGYFEVRMKVPRGAGLVTGVFSYAGRDGRVRPNEIDIEILGRNTRVAELTIHEGGQATSQRITLPFDAADGFHTYGFDWQPGFVRWYADGKLIHVEDGPAARRVTRPQQFILNLWASRELHAWVGRIDMARAPWRLEVSCIAYAPAYSGTLCSQDPPVSPPIGLRRKQ